MTSGPIIWSETRQELCESLPYYRAYQTGCYVTSSLGRPPSISETKLDRKSTILKDTVPYGYLLAGWPSRRDAWDHNGRVIVSHGGGKSEVDDAPLTSLDAPKASLKQDQSSSDNTIRALLHSSRHRLPIVLIAADSYALLPFKLACSYAVLGWYLITDGWAERENTSDDAGFVRWKFRFEWILAQGECWWELPPGPAIAPWDPRQRTELFTKAQRKLVKHIQGKSGTDPASSSAASSRASSVLPVASSSKVTSREDRERLLYGPIRVTAELVSTVAFTHEAEVPCNLANAASCLSCRSLSPLVYTIGWMCLQPDCTSFFLLPSGQRPKEDTLTFSESFLQPQGRLLNDAFPSGRPPFSLIPARPSTRSMDQARGLWCRKCGRLSCREVIFQPRCAHCGHRVGKWKPLPVVAPPRLCRSPFDFSAASDRTEGLIFDPIISSSSGIELVVRKVDGLAMYTFKFPAMFGDCRVHLIQADIDGGAQESEADQIFADLQRLTWPSEVERRVEDQVVTANGRAESTPRLVNQMEDNPEVSKGIETEPSSTSPSLSTDFTAPASDPRPPPPNTIPRLVPFRRHVLKNHLGGLGRMLTQQFTCNYGVAYKHVVAMGTEPLSPLSPPPILSTLSLLHARTRAALSLPQDFNELYPVLYLEHQAMNFHDDGEPGLGPVVSSFSLGSTCRMKFRLKAKHQPQFSGVKVRDRTVLDLPLRHGSVVVQEGHDLQRYFEHCVSPDGFRIAVTARRIDAKENDKGTTKRKTGRKSDSGGTPKVKRRAIKVKLRVPTMDGDAISDEQQEVQPSAASLIDPASTGSINAIPGAASSSASTLPTAAELAAPEARTKLLDQVAKLLEEVESALIEAALPSTSQDQPTTGGSTTTIDRKRPASTQPKTKKRRKARRSTRATPRA